MKFYVIYDFDVTKDIPIEQYKPYNTKLWKLTEDDAQYEYEYLGENRYPNPFKNGKHRKYVAELSKKDFLRFLEFSGLTFEDVQTMGSLTDLGWLPAFAFHGDSMHYQAEQGLIWQSAYVTPMPEPVRDFHNHLETNLELFPDLLAKAENKEMRYWNLLHDAFKGMFT